MSRRLFVTFVSANVFVLALSSVTFAENAPAVSKSRYQFQRSQQYPQPTRLKGKPRTATRRLASVDENNYSQIRTNARTRRSTTKDWEVSLGIVSGFATSNTNITTDQQERDASRFNNNVYLGLAVDTRFEKYLGAELDGYLNVAPTRVSTTRNAINGSTTTQDKSLQQYGGSLAFKAQYPVWVERVSIIPKVGAGYGIVGLKQTNFGTTTSESINVQTRGAFVVGGLDIAPIRDFWVSTDYSISIAAGGDVDRTVGVTNTLSTDLMAARFERLRVGAFVRIADPFVIGAQYVARRVRYQPTGETQTFEERMNQFLGLVMVGF